MAAATRSGAPTMTHVSAPRSPPSRGPPANRDVRASGVSDLPDGRAPRPDEHARLVRTRHALRHRILAPVEAVRPGAVRSVEFARGVGTRGDPFARRDGGGDPIGRADRDELFRLAHHPRVAPRLLAQTTNGASARSDDAPSAATHGDSPFDLTRTRRADPAAILVDVRAVAVAVDGVRDGANLRGGGVTGGTIDGGDDALARAFVDAHACARARLDVPDDGAPRAVDSALRSDIDANREIRHRTRDRDGDGNLREVRLADAANLRLGARDGVGVDARERQPTLALRQLDFHAVAKFEVAHRATAAADDATLATTVVRHDRRRGRGSSRRRGR